jgi:hypothetical protein
VASIPTKQLPKIVPFHRSPTASLRIDFEFDKSEANSFVDLTALAGNIENTKAGIRPKIEQRTNQDFFSIVLVK